AAWCRSMSIAASSLPELDDVIRHGSSVRRVHTLMRVAALFAATAENLSSEHVDLFDDVFCRLLAEVHADSRIDLSKQLAPVDNATAQFSEGSLEALIEEAASDNWLADKLVLRRDLPLRILRETLKHTSKAGQERLLAMANPELQEEIKRTLAMADRIAGSAE